MTQIEGVTLASRSDWTVLRPLLFESIGQTLEMVLVTMIVGGILGLSSAWYSTERVLATYSKTRSFTASST